MQPLAPADRDLSTLHCEGLTAIQAIGSFLPLIPGLGDACARVSGPGGQCSLLPDSASFRHAVEHSKQHGTRGSLLSFATDAGLSVEKLPSVVTKL